MSITSISEQDQNSLQEKMGEFLKNSESQWTALIDKGGNLLAQCGDTTNLNLPTLSALGAGSFAATQELAKRLGEKEFASLYHEGRDIGILMTALQFDCLLLAVFGKQTNEGLVRHYVQQTAQDLNTLLTSISEKP